MLGPPTATKPFLFFVRYYRRLPRVRTRPRGTTTMTRDLEKRLDKRREKGTFLQSTFALARLVSIKVFVSCLSSKHPALIKYTCTARTTANRPTIPAK